jgi:hypothetical protein
MIPLVGFFVILGVAAVVFEIFTIRRDRKADVEKDQTPLHTEICGARIDLQNWSTPFVRLTLYSTFAVISYARKVVLPYEVVDDVTTFGSFLGDGVRIHHHQPNTPERLIIWSSDTNGLQKKLSTLVAVHDRTSESGN